MSILSVDLASKFSAGMVVDDERRVHWEDDSSGFKSGISHTPLGYIAELRAVFDNYEPEIVLVEDVPYGIESQAMTKPVTRLQGVVIREFADVLDRLYFVNPSSWMLAYPGTARPPKGLTKAAGLAARNEAMLAHATERGYAPPDLTTKHKNTAVYRKAMTDYVAAFLIADWGLTHLGALTNLAGVQPANI